MKVRGMNFTTRTMDQMQPDITTFNYKGKDLEGHCNNINDEIQGLRIKVLTQSKGYGKADHQYDKLIFKDDVDEDYQKYGTEPFMDKIRN